MKIVPSRLVHGYARRDKVHPLHRVWREMIQRCTNKNNVRYEDYGGRGIRVCDRWIESFEVFLKDMGPRPPGKGQGGRSLYSVDRKNNDGNYEPGNCRWATTKEQARSSRRARYLSLGKETMLLSEWAVKLRVSNMALIYRLRIGMTEEEALTKPFRRRREASAQQ
jgi:hypothetical protein